MRLRNVNKSLLAGITLCLLMGCQKQPAESYAVAAAEAPMPMMAPAAVGQAAAQRKATLAYEHTVSIELDRKVLPARLREIEAACAESKPVECTVLQVSLDSQQDVPSGVIQMRIAPEGVNPTIEAASRDGKLTMRSTRAEDLAQPISDTQRRLALMTTHRDRLTEIMKNKDLKIEQLITVSKELSTVQNDIDSLSTEHAQLRRRVDTELLTINLAPPRAVYYSQQTPIRDALRVFGSNFREAVGNVISFIAIVMPWLVIVLPGLFLLRASWSWVGRTLAKRRQTP